MRHCTTACLPLPPTPFLRLSICLASSTSSQSSWFRLTSGSSWKEADRVRRWQAAGNSARSHCRNCPVGKLVGTTRFSSTDNWALPVAPPDITTFQSREQAGVISNFGIMNSKLLQEQRPEQECLSAWSWVTLLSGVFCFNLDSINQYRVHH